MPKDDEPGARAPHVRAIPSSVQDILVTLGRDLSLARRRRRIPQRVMAARMLVNVETLSRLERGDPGVGIGVLATAMWTLGLHERLAQLLTPGTDALAQAMDIDRVPEYARDQGERDMDF